MMIEKEYVVFVSNSPYGDYDTGEVGILVGFCRGGNDVPCAIVRKQNGLYVMAEMPSIRYKEN